MKITPKVRNNICLTSHPEGCAALVEQQIERVRVRGRLEGPRRALIIGSSLIVLSQVPPKWAEIPVIGLVGFVAAGVMAFVLLVSIIRHGRM